MKLASGSETKGLKHIDSRPLISPRVNRVHDFLGAVARLRKILWSNAPDSSHILASGRIGERTLAGKLVAFLPMLASALAVTLAGNHGWTGTFAPDIAGRQRNVHDRQSSSQRPSIGAPGHARAS